MKTVVEAQKQEILKSHGETDEFKKKVGFYKEIVDLINDQFGGINSVKE